MNKLILLVLISVLSSCATRPTFKRDYTAINAKDFKYEDKNIVFTYVPTSYGSSVPISIQNKSDKAVKILWDETTFINQSGQSEKVIHEGVRLLERNSSTPPSIVPPHANIQDAITPTSKIEWSGSNWQQSVICGDEGEVFNGMLHNDEHCLNQTFGLFITYEIEGKKNSFGIKYKLTKRELLPPGQ